MEKRKHYVQETKEDKAMVMDEHLDIMCDFNRITSMANNIRDLQAMSAYVPLAWGVIFIILSFIPAYFISVWYVLFGTIFSIASSVLIFDVYKKIVRKKEQNFHLFCDAVEKKMKQYGFCMSDFI